MVISNTDWVREIKGLEEATRKYVIEFEEKIYEMDHEQDYEEADVIINVENEITMFSGINKIGCAKIYERDKVGNYNLI